MSASPETFRNNIRTKLTSKIGEKYNKIATNIEKAIFNYAIKEATQKKIIKKWENQSFKQLYTDRLRSIMINMNDSTIEKLQTHELNPQTFAFMTHQEMNPERWKNLIEDKIKRDASKFNTNIEASTDMFTCKKCKSKKCTYYELQTRSADEPATIFITCLDCGKHWKS
jgi:transcription elongation factor S-II